MLSDLARLTALRLLLPREQFLDPWLGWRPVLTTHINIREFRSPVPSERRVKSPTELYFRIWCVSICRTLGRKKVLNISHNSVGLAHSLLCLVSLKVWSSFHVDDRQSPTELIFCSLCVVEGYRKWLILFLPQLEMYCDIALIRNGDPNRTSQTSRIPCSWVFFENKIDVNFTLLLMVRFSPVKHPQQSFVFRS